MSTQEPIVQALEALRTKRGAIDTAIEALELAIEALQVVDSAPSLTRVLEAHQQRDAQLLATSEPLLRSRDVMKQPAAPDAERPAARARVAKSRPASSSPRLEAVLRFLRANNGLGTSKQLRAAMPSEPGLNDAQREDAYQNTMTKLRVKGLVARTGDTWSLVQS